ncbi:hypothetical protein CPB85DRAFT_1320128 [Mucidula mucida]|nr:hypothetical protein CPB85DRAFT_1320128 [Mucidula mucida]
MLAFKLCPSSLSPRAPELHRISTPICSQRRSRCSYVDTVATDASDITIDSHQHWLNPTLSVNADSLLLAQTTKKEIRPLARRMSDSLTAVSAPFTTSTTSLFSPASNLYLPRQANSAYMVLFGRKTAVPRSSGDVAVPFPLVKKLCSLVPEECGSLEEETCTPFVEESPLKKRKVFRPAKTGRKISRGCGQVLL